MIVADAFLRYLAAAGVEYLFANAGTDFAPLIEAFARAEKQGTKVPRPIAVPHENLAVAMAHGYTAVSGRAQAVMAHVNVGTANMINGVTNAARARIPMYVMAGRTPLTESGELTGSRNFIIHWAQEMFDQAGMLRELVKWDYELRAETQVADVIDRMVEIANSPPAGPVYLTLPREVLAADYDGDLPSQVGRRAVPAVPQPLASDVERLADWIAGAECPLILATSSGRDPANVASLAALAEKHAIGVIQFAPTHMCLPKQHPMCLGFWPGEILRAADLVLVLDSDVPWIPAIASPPASARIAHVGIDPVYTSYPMRSFPSDLTIAADSAAVLSALDRAMDDLAPANAAITARRRREFESGHAELEAEWETAAAAGADRAPLQPEWVTRRIAAAVGPDALIINEYPAIKEQLDWSVPGTFLGNSSGGGLGWGLGAALGARLAAPDRLVVAMVGDGSYMFGNPTPAHLVAAAEGLPVLFVVFNNHRWHAVTRATAGIFPEGDAVRTDPLPLTSLEPSPAFEMVAQASGAHAERVSQPSDLDGALQRAVHAVTQEGRQALLNVECSTFG